MNIGDRVRLTSAGIGVTLRSPYGTIVRDDEGWWVVHLDEPCLFAHPGCTPEELAALGEPRDLQEIIEDEDNMEVLTAPPTATPGAAEGEKS